MDWVMTTRLRSLFMLLVLYTAMQLLLDVFASDLDCSSHVEPADHPSSRNRREVFHFLSRYSEAKVQRSILVNPEIVQISPEYHKTPSGSVARVAL
ncbi:hypothetical protein DER45DRAFT_573752 [Fusarium avenaceum]|nr:hypothetical protein DER45DRAFT_573752 [Fusarium avenaceum]